MFVWFGAGTHETFPSKSVELVSRFRVCIVLSGWRMSCVHIKVISSTKITAGCFSLGASVHPSCVCRTRASVPCSQRHSTKTTYMLYATISLATAVPAPSRLFDNDFLDRVKPKIIINFLGFGFPPHSCQTVCVCANASQYFLHHSPTMCFHFSPKNTEAIAICMRCHIYPHIVSNLYRIIFG